MRPPLGDAAHRRKDQIVDLRLRRRLLAFERHLDAGVRRLRLHRLALEHHRVEALLVELLPDLHKVAVGAEHQCVQHLHDIHPRAERRVDGGHLEADDAAADHQHRLRPRPQLEGAGRIDDPGIVRQERQPHRLAAGGDDRFVEAHDLLLAAALLAVAAGDLHLQVVRVEEAADPAHHLDLAGLRHAGEPTGHPTDHLLLPGAQLVEVDLRLAEADAMGRERPGFVHDAGRMQERLRRYAADVEADTAESRITLDDHRAHAEVGGTERGRVAARSPAEYQHLAFDIHAPAAGTGGGCVCCCRCGRRLGRRLGRRFGRPLRCGLLLRRRRACRGGSLRTGLARRLEERDHAAGGDLVADLDAQFGDPAGGRRRDLHRRLVRLDRDQALLLRHVVPGLDQDLDDFDVLEIADIRNLQFARCHLFPFPLACGHGVDPDRPAGALVELDAGAHAGLRNRPGRLVRVVGGEHRPEREAAP